MQVQDESPMYKKRYEAQHDDSGYMGTYSASKLPEEKPTDVFDAEQIKILLEEKFGISRDMMWASIVPFLMFVVMFMSVCYVIVMGQSGDHQLGGKKAAIKFYYDRVYGVSDDD